MPQIFVKETKIKVIQYGIEAQKELSLASIANDMYATLRSILRR